MTDTNSQHAAPAHTEGDGVNYRGIVVFIVILVATTVVCELIVVGMFKFYDASYKANDVARAPLSAPAGTLPPAPNLLLNEPANLQQFRERELNELTTYGWLDKSAGAVRLPIDRAKDLVIERGLPVRSADAADVKTDKKTDKKTETPAVKKTDVKK